MNVSPSQLENVNRTNQVVMGWCGVSGHAWFILFFTLLSLQIADIAVLGGALPDANTLLEGVRSARSQVSDLQVHFTLSYESPTTKRVFTNSAVFHGASRVFHSTNGVEATHALFDGTNAYTFSSLAGQKLSHLRVQNLDGSFPVFCFDLRTIGLDRNYFSTSTLEALLDTSTAAGSHVQPINGDDQEGAYLVVLNYSGKYTSTYEIVVVPKLNFRIVKYLQRVTGLGERVAESEYDSVTNILPSRVYSKEYNTEGQLIAQRKLVITAIAEDKSARSGVGLSRLDLPVGTEVVDYRIQQRIGTWTGLKIKPENEVTVHPREPVRRVASRLWYSFLAVLVGIPALWHYLSGRRSNHSASSNSH